MGIAFLVRVRERISVYAIHDDKPTKFGNRLVAITLLLTWGIYRVCAWIMV